MSTHVEWLSLMLAVAFFVYAHRSLKRLRYVQLLYGGHHGGSREIFYQILFFVFTLLTIVAGTHFVHSILL
jgi:hypothetical protein